jgi:hypothetical protein
MLLLNHHKSHLAPLRLSVLTSLAQMPRSLPELQAFSVSLTAGDVLSGSIKLISVIVNFKRTRWLDSCLRSSLQLCCAQQLLAQEVTPAHKGKHGGVKDSYSVYDSNTQRYLPVRDVAQRTAYDLSWRQPQASNARLCIVHIRIASAFDVVLHRQ